MTIFDHMTTAEYCAYLQNIESGQHEPSEEIGELPSSHFGRMSAAEYQAMLHPQKQPAQKSAPQKKPALPIPTESEEQQAVMEWAEAASGKWPELRLLYHVPNEGRRSMATGGRLRAEGLKSGVPDLCLPSAHGEYHGLYIEMKRTKGGRATPEQKEWLEMLEEEGYKTEICNGADAAIKAIGTYLSMPKQKIARISSGQKAPGPLEWRQYEAYRNP